MKNMNDSLLDSGINTGIYRLFTPEEIQVATEQMNETASSRGVGCEMLAQHVQYMVAKNGKAI